jgi:ABC-type uncharacterized transport system substrate-binding protein
MSKQRILLLAKLAFLVIFCALVFHHKQTKPRIMVIHSYSADYSWVQEINTGISRFIDKHSNATVRWHYMDLQKHTDADSVRTATTIAAGTIEQWKPDIIVLFDDIAQKKVGMLYLDDPRVKIVFGGVNAKASDYQYDKAKNVTGILERKPLTATEDTISMLAAASGMPATQKPRALLIGDASFSFSAGLSAYEAPEYVWKKTDWQKPIAVETFDQWKAQVALAQRTTDVLLVSDYRTLRLTPGGKTFANPKEVIAWTEANSRIPILGLVAISTEDGGAISIAASGYEQGSVAAEMAYDISRGKAPNAIPIKSTEQYLIGLRKSAMVKRGIEPPSIYEAFARATDKFFP